MELYLNREKISHIENVLNTSVTQEETMEMIVPDALPDILRAVCTDVTVMVRGKDTDVGRVSVSGVAAATVVYVPEGVGGVRRINAEMPFTIAAVESEITPASRVVVRVSAVTADVSIINPRKFVLRADIRAEFSCYNDGEILVTSDVELAQDGGIELLRESRAVCIPVDVREKSFVISDEIALANGSPAIGDILSPRAAVTALDAKVVGNKVIFRGNAGIALLYNCADSAQLHSADLVTEFSQIMEFETISEECSFDIALMLTGVYVEPGGTDDSGSKSVSIELHVVAQCVAAEKKTVSFVSDVYSTRHVLEQAAEELAFENKDFSIRVNSVFRGMLEAPGDVSRVISVSAALGTAESAAESGALVLRAPVHVKCVYMDAEGRVLAVTGRFEVEGQTDARPGSAYTTTAAAGREVYGAPSGGGIELRIPVDFAVTETTIVQISQLGEISYDEEMTVDTSRLPSLMISKAARGDTLWKLAKKHHSTATLILSANGLESEDEIVEDQMLIVPKKR